MDPNQRLNVDDALNHPYFEGLPNQQQYVSHDNSKLGSVINNQNEKIN